MSAGITLRRCCCGDQACYNLEPCVWNEDECDAYASTCSTGTPRSFLVTTSGLPAIVPDPALHAYSACIPNPQSNWIRFQAAPSVGPSAAVIADRVVGENSCFYFAEVATDGSFYDGRLPPGHSSHQLILIRRLCVAYRITATSAQLYSWYDDIPAGTGSILDHPTQNSNYVWAFHFNDTKVLTCSSISYTHTLPALNCSSFITALSQGVPVSGSAITTPLPPYIDGNACPDDGVAFKADNDFSANVGNIIGLDDGGGKRCYLVTGADTCGEAVTLSEEIMDTLTEESSCESCCDDS